MAPERTSSFLVNLLVTVIYKFTESYNGSGDLSTGCPLYKYVDDTTYI